MRGSKIIIYKLYLIYYVRASIKKSTGLIGYGNHLDGSDNGGKSIELLMDYAGLCSIPVLERYYHKEQHDSTLHVLNEACPIFIYISHYEQGIISLSQQNQ